MPALALDSRRPQPRRPETQHPGIEFLGKARAARQKLTEWAERDGPEMLRIARSAQRVYDHRTTNAPLSVMENTRAKWLAIAKEGCLSQSRVVGNRDLRITDVRLVGALGQQLDPRYMPGEKQAAFCAVSNQLTLGKRRMFGAAPVVFGVTLNAVGFFYQMSFNAT